MALRMSFRANANVARSYVSTQLLKGWFMAKAQMLVVAMSGIMLFMGVLLLYTGIRLEWSQATALALVAAIPVAIVAAPLAIIIEGMNVVASRNLGDVRRKVEQDVAVIRQNKKAYTKEEQDERIKRAQNQYWQPGLMVGVFSLFSLMGAEIFWHKLTEHSGLFYQIIGYVIGLVTSVALIYLEMNQDLVERGINRSISSNALVYRAMEMDAKSQILYQFSKESEKQLNQPEMRDAISRAAKQNLFGPMAEIIKNMQGGATSVEAEQLRRIVDGKIAERDAADKALAGGEQDSGSIPKIGPGGRKPYRTDAKQKCRDIILQYGQSQVENNVEEYAREAGVSATTLRKYLAG